MLSDYDRDDDDDDDDVSPETKAQREKVRRQQNNARERLEQFPHPIFVLIISREFLKNIIQAGLNVSEKRFFSLI